MYEEGRSETEYTTALPALLCNRLRSLSTYVEKKEAEILAINHSSLLLLFRKALARFPRTYS